MTFPFVRLRPSSPRRKFTEAEDRKLRVFVHQLGTASGEDDAKCMANRTPRQCRDRYKNYLLDSLTHSPWTAEEDAILIKEFHAIGPKWVEIAKMINGRSGSQVKNRWHRHLALQHWESATPIQSEEDTDNQQQTEQDKKDDAVLLCPAIALSGGDWIRIFDRIEETISHNKKPPDDAEAPNE
jgi:hypothetical protein